MYAFVLGYKLLRDIGAEYEYSILAPPFWGIVSSAAPARTMLP